MEDDVPTAGSRGLYVVMPKAEIEFLKLQITEARQFAFEARESSRSNKQSIDEVIKPKLDIVDDHEKAIQRSRGVLFAISAIWTAVTLGVTLWLAN